MKRALLSRNQKGLSTLKHFSLTSIFSIRFPSNGGWIFFNLSYFFNLQLLLRHARPISLWWARVSLKLWRCLTTPVSVTFSKLAYLPRLSSTVGNGGAHRNSKLRSPQTLNLTGDFIGDGEKSKWRKKILDWWPKKQIQIWEAKEILDSGIAFPYHEWIVWKSFDLEVLLLHEIFVLRALLEWLYFMVLSFIFLLVVDLIWII